MSPPRSAGTIQSQSAQAAIKAAMNKIQYPEDLSSLSPRSYEQAVQNSSANLENNYESGQYVDFVDDTLAGSPLSTGFDESPASLDLRNSGRRERTGIMIEPCKPTANSSLGDDFSNSETANEYRDAKDQGVSSESSAPPDSQPSNDEGNNSNRRPVVPEPDAPKQLRNEIISELTPEDNRNLLFPVTEEEAVELLAVHPDTFSDLVSVIPSRRVSIRTIYPRGAHEQFGDVLVGPDPEPIKKDFSETPKYIVTEFKEACGRTISTYPWLPSHEHREGYPTCDRFYTCLMDGWWIAAVADGCSWGARPLEAASRCMHAFCDYVMYHLPEVHDTQRIGRLFLTALGVAHKAIITHKETAWEAGNSTLIGGLLVELKKEFMGFSSEREFAFVCANIGDCKAYHISAATLEVTDITFGNRHVDDPRDPGGRLGPFSGEGDPDLRNLQLYYMPCAADDIILLVSDGIHDNLDPEAMGKKPRDVGLNFDDWKSVPQKKGEKAKTKWQCKMIQDLCLKDEELIEPRIICDKLVAHCRQNTEPSRQYMQQNEGAKVPQNYQEFPGKMDHTTCLAISVIPRRDDDPLLAERKQLEKKSKDKKKNKATKVVASEPARSSGAGMDEAQKKINDQIERAKHRRMLRKEKEKEEKDRIKREKKEREREIREIQRQRKEEEKRRKSEKIPSGGGGGIGSGDIMSRPIGAIKK